MRAPTDVAAALRTAVATTVRGKPEAVDLAVATLLAGGHLLVEDLPGTGKTLLARSLAAAIGGRFGRVQCTPDLLPSDITGTSVHRPDSGEWQFRPGPLFANVVLVDEVNRASPRTQAALLQPMEEHHVTVDGTTWNLPEPFLVIATQNPFGQVGTFPLPESQLDRFALVLSMGLPERSAEREIVTGQGGTGVLGSVQAVTSPDELVAVQRAVAELYAADAIVDYLLDLVEATRTDVRLSHGVSPRVSTGMIGLARARAVVDGRDFVTPEDVQAIFVGACRHRVMVDGRVDSVGAGAILTELLGRVPVPRPTA
ncbi:AAA family ATPase [Dermatobacter hominis]|uniref:AAA family ATPase n=1 Tax=Dermatobacter hominis TaxID=2884263 RepID=UPI001D123109|nr:MoxR family ATPase [Dermatobacter hominis]UDY37953.1 MoxR family ATPase [Dermatobacter hominis]